MNTKKILIVSAHADDHILCAGSIFKLQDMGYDACEVVLTNSMEGNHYQKDKMKNKPFEVIKLRFNEFDQASKFLGLKEKFLFMEEDLNLEYSKQLMLKLLKIIRKIKPEIILTLNQHDYHKDHIASAKLVEEASLWAANSLRPDLGKSHRTKMVLYTEGFLPIAPDVLIDITNYQDKKFKLFEIYQSQADTRTTTMVDLLTKLRGYHLRKNGQELAEGFTIDKKFPNILFD